MKFIIVFFGITRSLQYTIASINKNVFKPARTVAQPSVYAHFFDNSETNDLRGRKEGYLDLGEADLLKPDWLEFEAADNCLLERNFEGLKNFGDAWNDDFVSLRNLIHQLHSMDRVTTRALADGADICFFCRPDQRYHDSLETVFREGTKNLAEDRVYLPEWQSWGGYNDRFALAVGRNAITSYGKRIEMAESFCAERYEPLNSEMLLKYSLEKSHIPVVKIPNRASRVRATGVQTWESFGNSEHSIRHRKRIRLLWKILDSSGLKPLIKVLYRVINSVRLKILVSINQLRQNRERN